MSMNFTANQFEEEYKPSKLRNWEIPRWHPQRPCGNKGRTKIVSNEKGHLLPGVPRSYTNPWGNFVGTWDLPKKISREDAFKLSAPTVDKIQKWRRHCQQEGCPTPPIPQITTYSKKSREAIAKQEALARHAMFEERKKQTEIKSQPRATRHAATQTIAKGGVTTETAEKPDVTATERTTAVPETDTDFAYLLQLDRPPCKPQETKSEQNVEGVQLSESQQFEEHNERGRESEESVYKPCPIHDDINGNN